MTIKDSLFEIVITSVRDLSKTATGAAIINNLLGGDSANLIGGDGVSIVGGDQ